MAATNSLSSRLEELRSRNPQSPPGESIYSGYSTPNRFSGSFIHSHSQSLTASNESRANLQRRFTADSNTFPTPISPIGNAHLQNVEPIDMTATTLHKVNAIEKKRLELEKVRETKKRMEEDLKRYSNIHEIHEEEYTRLANNFQDMHFSPGRQSEPATPPEYSRDMAYGSMYSNRHRFSSASLTSPPGLQQRLSRSGSQVASPPSESAQSRDFENDGDKLPSKSVPASRRGSSDRFSQYLPDGGTFGQRSVANNRYSMPVTLSMRQKRESAPDFASSMGLSQIDTTSGLFRDDDDGYKDATASPDVKSYLQANTTEDKFPILVRSNHKPGTLSASSTALDLAYLQESGSEPSSEPKTNGWPSSFGRHRHSQHSIPQSLIESQNLVDGALASPSASSQQSVDTVVESPVTARQANRHSMEATLAILAQKSNYGQVPTNSASSVRPNLANLPSSYSTNDIPTLKGSTGGTATTTVTSPAADTQSSFHKHNASLGRIPANAASRRVSRDLVGIDSRQEDMFNNAKQLHSELQANAQPFGPLTTVGSPVEPSMIATAPQFSSPAYYGGYGLPMMNMMQMGAASPYGNGMPYYQSQNQYGSFATPYNAISRGPDSQARIIQQRRMQNAEDGARFSNAKIEQYVGEIYSLCKDQHGCRYLQKQLETRNPETVQTIFLETSPHVVELMTDPFGNYLCQKLLEHSNDSQRTALVNNASSDMVQIALNQHGTRALQKMIEFLSTPEQIQTVIYALKDKVVELIQDLNGNHVVQKCLNRLIAEDSQFIFNAVGTNCVTVGTHRHGCCVLQRCIDHASGQQRADLVSQITQNAHCLVQDPFGNYVLQYIVDLNEPSFTNPLCYTFQTRVVEFSKHKFSSNVVEKCIRHADPGIATMMIDEMLIGNEIEKMLRDSYANYVVQTALDHAEVDTRTRLVDGIRPILPSIRHTPHGRRIQSKISASGNSSLMSSPVESPMPQHAMMVHGVNGGNGPRGGAHRAGGFYNQQNHNPYAMNVMPGQQSYGQAPLPTMNNGRRISNGMTGFPYGPVNGQNYGQPVQPFNRAPQATGFNFF